MEFQIALHSNIGDVGEINKAVEKKSFKTIDWAIVAMNRFKQNPQYATHAYYTMAGKLTTLSEIRTQI